MYCDFISTWVRLRGSNQKVLKTKNPNQDYLIQDVVSPPLGGHVQHGVEALGALLDEDLPAPVVVPLPAQTVHLQHVATLG